MKSPYTILIKFLEREKIVNKKILENLLKVLGLNKRVLRKLTKKGYLKQYKVFNNYYYIYDKYNIHKNNKRKRKLRNSKLFL